VYLGQGWFIVVAVVPLIHSLGWHDLCGWAAGGLAYTLASSFSRSTGCVTPRPLAPVWCWPAALPTTSPSSCTSFRRGPELPELARQAAAKAETRFYNLWAPRCTIFSAN